MLGAMQQITFEVLLRFTPDSGLFDMDRICLVVLDADTLEHHTARTSEQPVDYKIRTIPCRTVQTCQYSFQIFGQKTN